MRDRLNAELKVAMKGGQKRRVETIRLINAALKDRDIEARTTGKVIGEAEILSLLQKMTKSRQESYEIYVKAGRDDLATQEREEIDIISEYLPQPMSSVETEQAVDWAISEMQASSIKDMGKVVGVLKTSFAGRMDFAQASAMLKVKLRG